MKLKSYSFSRILEMNGRLEIGRRLLKLDGCAPGFFKYRSYCSGFETGRDSSRKEGGSDDGSNEGNQQEEAGFNKDWWKRI